MLAYAGVLDAGGDDVRDKSVRLGGMVVDGDVLQAAVLCPGEVAGVEAAITSAAAQALWVGGELEVSSRYLRTSVEALQFVDEQLANAEELFWTAAGWAAGGLLPLAALGAAATLLTNPALAALLLANKDVLLEELQETLYDQPWLLEALTRMAPGLLQGGAFSLTSLLPGGPLLLAALTGGAWPSGDYTTSVAGLLALANRFGLLDDVGEFGVDPVGEPRDLTIDPDHPAQSLLVLQNRLYSHDARVQVIEVAGDPPSYVVQIPGTQEWGPQRGDNPVDLTTNVALMAGQDAIMEQLVAEAMRDAGIPPGAEVMLTGHSQGGITAMNMAADPGIRSEFNVTSVLTAGSPVGRVDVPDGVSVLSVEHVQDVVPMLDGAGNPDRPDWTTVRRDLDVPADQENLGRAHGADRYAETGGLVDDSDDPSVVDWREDNANFFGSGTLTQYEITPEEP